MTTDVKLISHSTAPQGTGLDNCQELIAYCARVSNPSNQMNKETSEKLIKYLIKHAHWSPLEMVSACLEINTTRDIAHQIVRHRSFSFQEFSQRYADPAEFGNQFVLREARLQDEKNRQNSIGLGTTQQEMNLINDWESQQQKVIDAAKEAYEWAIDNGIAKEQARAVLPEGNTETTLYMAGNLRSWIHYCMLRTEQGTQKEHRLVAQKCWDILSQHFPDVAKAVNEL